MRPAALCTFTLLRKGLLLRVDKFEPRDFRQFSTEQSIGNVICQRLSSCTFLIFVYRQKAKWDQCLDIKFRAPMMFKFYHFILNTRRQHYLSSLILASKCCIFLISTWPFVFFKILRLFQELLNQYQACLYLFECIFHVKSKHCNENLRRLFQELLIQYRACLYLFQSVFHV